MQLSRLPIRVKLTIAFGMAMLVMLASAALFVYLRLRADLDERIDASLRSRVAALIEEGEPSLEGAALEDPEEAFAQLLSPSGRVIRSVGTLRVPALSASEARQAATAPIILERELPRVDGRARLLARPARRGDRVRVVVVGQSLVDRNDALANVVSSFAVGGAIAIVLASLIGYAVASAGLAPVEAMRRRARDVSLRPGDEGLPLPAAHDEIRNLAETLNEMLARLRDAFERESRFVADASHELRTPIAIIKTELEGALQLVGPETRVHESLATAVEECDRLVQLAEDLLVIARSADGQLPVRRELTEARPLLDGVRDRFSERASRRDRSIRVEVESGLVVNADPMRMRQALGNLVENALRHGRGEIVLSARRAADGIEIDVSDEGPGFPPEFAANAFERFARSDRARTGDGVGLGLAIVQAIAEAHSGSAEIIGASPTVLRVRIPNAI